MNNSEPQQTASSTAENVTLDTIDTATPPAEEVVYFEDLALSDDVLDALWDMRFEKCTPVQGRCIPYILEDRGLSVADTLSAAKRTARRRCGELPHYGTDA